MAEHSKIEWTDATWNIVTGCSIDTPGCIHCYAQKLAGTRLQRHPSRAGLTRMTKNGPVWTGEVRLNEQWMVEPLKWKRGRNIFVCAHGDLHHKDVQRDWLCRIYTTMAIGQQHQYQVLTKRAQNMADFLLDPATLVQIRDRNLNITRIDTDPVWPGWPLPHVLVGVSVERQQEADLRRPHLERLAKAGWRTFVSYEPALGQVDWKGWEFLSWMISGGESGNNARASHPDWHRATRDWCAGNDIPYLFKQWGEWAPYDRGHVDGAVLVTPNSLDTPLQRFGKKLSGRLLDGREHNEMPAR